MKVGDKVKSKCTNKIYRLSTFSDRYKHININYVRKHEEEFEKVNNVDKLTEIEIRMKFDYDNDPLSEEKDEFLQDEDMWWLIDELKRTRQLLQQAHESLERQDKVIDKYRKSLKNIFNAAHNFDWGFYTDLQAEGYIYKEAHKTLRGDV